MKSDEVYGLESAVWPAFLVDGACVIRRANSAAIKVFGPILETGSVPLASLWLAENALGPEELLGRASAAVTTLTPLQLMGDGTMLAFRALVCAVTGAAGPEFLIQLLPAGPREAKSPPAEAKSPPGDAKSPAMEAGLAHRQKLDCALQLARTVALDFNNALTSILGHTSLVLSKIEPKSPWRASLVEVEKSASKAAEIANDLANFSRQEKETKVQQSGNVNVLLQRNVDMFKGSPTAQSGKEIEWAPQFERRLYTAKFDEAKMQQAFLKILENSVESLGPRGRINIQTKNIELTQPTQDRNAQLAAGAYVCVEITDNGSGIEAEVLPRIFEPFFTTKRASKHRGLGLVWVYGIVTNHGGGVAVSSQSGVGTSVRIYLPADKKYVKDDSVNTADLNGTETILMVDDEDLVLTMGQTILAAYGYKVLLANSGQKAIETLSKPENHVDLVITDLVMPGMSGRELVERVRSLWPNIHIICSSGYVRPTTQEQEETGYLQKPFTSQDLLLKVKQVLFHGESITVD